MNCGIASAQDETVIGETGEDAPVFRSDTDDLINRTAEVRDPYARWCGRGFPLSRLYENNNLQQNIIQATDQNISKYREVTRHVKIVRCVSSCRIRFYLGTRITCS